LKQIGILGSTGSIGTQAISIVENNRDKYFIDFLTAGTNWESLLEQAIRLGVKKIGIADISVSDKLISNTPDYIEVYTGMDAICELVRESQADLILAAIVGFAGVMPTFTAIDSGKSIALANKESLVSAGELIMNHAQTKGIDIIAVDSEHSAILQCLAGETTDAVEKLILTASGGPFRTWDKSKFGSISITEALKHPNWSMGNKITIDSATLMNKGLEVIEAKWLFDMGANKIDVVVHPQSIIHSMVQFRDGSVKAQLGIPEMSVPIAYALAYPRRIAMTGSRIDLTETSRLDFEKPDYEKFPCLNIAFESLKSGSGYCNAMNAANEIAVAAFLNSRIRFTEISTTIEHVLQERDWANVTTMESIIVTDNLARKSAHNYISSLDK